MNASLLLRSFVLSSVGALTIACGGQSSDSTTSGDTKVQLADESAESCALPASVPPPPAFDAGESPPPGCTGSAPAGQICNESDGSCTSLCPSGNYDDLHQRRLGQRRRRCHPAARQLARLQRHPHPHREHLALLLPPLPIASRPRP
jgi:hypothetical protein